MLIISWPWALFQSGFLIIWRISFLEKWQLANKFSVSKVNCDGNTLPSVCKKRVDDFTIFFKSAMYLLKTLPCKLNTVSNILKSKESPRMTFELAKSVNHPEFTDQSTSQLAWKKTSDFSTFYFLLISSDMIPELGNIHGANEMTSLNKIFF